MQVEDNLAYLMRDRWHGHSRLLRIRSARHYAAPTRSPYPDTIQAGQVIGNHAYLAVGAYGPGLDLLDVGDPSRPTLQSRYRYTTQHSGADVWSDGSLAYLADTGGIRILDVTDPSHPWPRGSLDTIGQPTQLQVVGDLVYVADAAGGLADPACACGSLFVGSIPADSCAIDHLHKLRRDLLGVESSLRPQTLNTPNCREYAAWPRCARYATMMYIAIQSDL